MTLTHTTNPPRHATNRTFNQRLTSSQIAIRGDAASEFEGIGPGGFDDEDLAVADAAGAGGADDVVGHFFRARILDPDADLDLGQERQAVFAAGVTVEVALLAAIALGLADHAGAGLQVRDDP